LSCTIYGTRYYFELYNIWYTLLDTILGGMITGERKFDIVNKKIDSTILIN